MPTEAEEQADVDFQNWLTYFRVALEGSASSMSTPQAIIRQADLIAQTAVKKQLERRGAT